MAIEPNNDYYAILGVSNTASIDEIKRSYRRLALYYHPDKNKDSSDATERFQLLSRAYDTLKDESSRCQYDRRWLFFRNGHPDPTEDARRASEEAKAKAKAKAIKEEEIRKEAAAAQERAAQQDAEWEQAAQEAEQTWRAARREAARKAAAAAVREQAKQERPTNISESEQEISARTVEEQRVKQAEAEFTAKPLREQLSIKKEMYLVELGKLEPRISRLRVEIMDLKTQMVRASKEPKMLERSREYEDKIRCRILEESVVVWLRERGTKYNELDVLLGIHEEWNLLLKGVNTEISREHRSSFRRSIGSMFKR